MGNTEEYIGKAGIFLTNNKSEGGMGFKDFIDMNSALLAKQAWRAFKNPQALGVRLLKAIYYPNGDLAQAKRKRNDSWAWASLIHGRDLVLESGRWTVGNGNSIGILEHRWLVNGERPTLREGQNIDVVGEIMNNAHNSWDFAKVTEAFNPQMAALVLKTPISWSCSQDGLWWPAAKSGEFSVKSGYYEITKRSQEVNPLLSISEGIQIEVWKMVWGLKIPQKLKVFLWKVSLDILPVSTNLRKKKIRIPLTCQICNKEEETIEHALLFCDWARAAWFGMPIQIVPKKIGFTTIQQWILQIAQQTQNQNQLGSYVITSLVCTLWLIWKGRNSFYFQEVKPNPMETVIKANLITEEYSKVCSTERRSAEDPCIRCPETRNYWRPPLQGIVKINSDTSYNQNTHQAHGGFFGKRLPGGIHCGSFQ